MRAVVGAEACHLGEVAGEVGPAGMASRRSRMRRPVGYDYESAKVAFRGPEVAKTAGECPVIACFWGELAVLAGPRFALPPCAAEALDIRVGLQRSESDRVIVSF